MPCMSVNIIPSSLFVQTLVIIKKGLSIEAVKVEFAEQEDLFVKMYNSFTKIENAESLLQLYELNHTEEMITAELSGDIVVESL